MPVYEYKALDSAGKDVKGIIDAESEAQARTKLRSAGTYPVSIKRSKGRTRGTGRKGSGIGLFERVRPEEVLVFTRQLATLVGAGIPLVPALSSLIEQTSNPALQRVIAEIRENVNEGSTLTKALSNHPKLFSSIYVNMIRAGEASGSLDVVLERLAEFGEKQQVLQARLQAALIYPIIMAVIGAGILFILVTYVVPNVTQVFSEMGKVLPWPTRFLIDLSGFLKLYWWLVLGGLALLIYGFRYLISLPFGRSAWDLFKLKFPVIGTVVRKVLLARFASTLGSLLNSSVELMASMNIVKTLIDNVHVAAVIEEAMDNVEKGNSMTVALSQSQWFPPMYVQMIAVGEQSGNLEGMLEKVAASYEREVETAILGMTSLIEPIMIVGMGVAVGFVVLSILLPIFEMNQMVG
ncbi:type II secretion system inner membrane protein GspF [Desulfosediminicola sp.]|uniref:type II secretion system inner membrane protein GspF n=1 Tax=Desulfosediminicola sp. TaxID=2886825 RepID=UPI003AF2E75E